MFISSIRFFGVLVLSFLIFKPFSGISQYATFYRSARNISAFSHFEDYRTIVNEYNANKNTKVAIASLDSLANLSILQHDYLQFLFLKNEVSNFYKFDNRFDEGYFDLNSAMQTFASKCDTMILEYAVSLRLLRGLHTRASSRFRAEEEMLISQLMIIDSLGIEGEPLTNTLVDYGMLLNRKGDKDNAIPTLYRARSMALQNDDLMSMAIADYSLISLVRDIYDNQETTIEVIKNDLTLLESQPTSMPIMAYMSYFNYLLGDKLFFNSKNTRQAIYYCEKTISCLDSLRYPVWNLKASTHSVLAYCYADLLDTAMTWHHFTQAKVIADTKPMSAYNKSLAYVQIADAVIPFCVDSTFMLLDSIAKQDGRFKFTEKIAEIEATALMRKGNYQMAIDVITPIFHETEMVSGVAVPIITDSLSYYNQLHLIALMTKCYKRIDEESGSNDNINIIRNLIAKQNDTYIKAIESNVYGYEITSLVKDFQVFLLPALEYLMERRHLYEMDQEIAKLFLSSKAIQLNANLSKLAQQSQVEADSSLFNQILNSTSQIQTVKTAIARTSTKSEERQQLNKQLNSLLIENLMLKYKQSRTIDKTYSPILIPDIRQIQLSLDEAEGIVEYTLSGNRVLSLFVTKDTMVFGTIEVENLSEIITDEIYQIRTGKKIGNNLSNILFQGIEDNISSIRQLVVIPDGQLSLIPFELLSKPSNGMKLIEEITLSYNYSTSLWYKKRNLAKNSGTSMLAVAPLFFGKETQSIGSLVYESNYRGEEELAPLFFSEQEVVEISAKYRKSSSQTKALVGIEASKSNLLKEIVNYDIIHFATHGMVNRQQHELSGLFLFPEGRIDGKRIDDDDFLSLGELYNLRLRANLVVLSACNSGSGAFLEGEGVMALPRGFIHAGVPNVIASLWRVNDEKTKDLMTSFYKYLLEGNSYAESLRLAKLESIEKGFLPLDWAGFVLIGG